ncbi:formimidoylglutamate deiminase [Dickeya sp. CFBP 2040]|uniref:formimidoylglutamate deiminase n=1 Tax=Dickeya sp. CFBP 2040 TaxID=2718531 RepID=UPI0014463D65|nr:formimidoylglutamate deiminase [Dickeya sp. CFBP 2040]NKI74102.1 formimidoylglutamate deiminase [Dickeya sp. CFBP 2040]
MSVYFAERALLPQGMARHVRLEVDEQGYLQSVTPQAEPEGAQRLSGIVLPTMVNLHSHAFQRAMAGLAEVAGDPQDSFWTWRDLMYRMVANLTPEQVGVIATRLYIDMLKGGYSQVAEFHYLHHDPHGKPYRQHDMLRHLLAAAQQVGIGQTMLPVLYSYSGFGAQPPQPGQARFIQDVDHYLRQQETLAALIQSYPLLNHGLCFHSLRAVSQNQMEDVLEATDSSLPVHIHIAEQQKEVNDCLNWSGERPVQWLFNRFAVDARWCLVHATHLDQQELNRLADSLAVAGLCPTTEANLGDGIFPLDRYVALGGRWGIGSDSHVSLNVVEELRWLEYGQRLRDHRRNRVATAQQAAVGSLLYAQALQGGAQACRVPVGELSAGWRADWLVLREDALLSAVADNSLLNRWLFAGDRQQIHEVWVAGKPVIEEGRHALDEDIDARFIDVMKTLQAVM